MRQARVDGPVRVYRLSWTSWTWNAAVSCCAWNSTASLDADQRELVLDRAMALDQDELDLDDLKWVVLMVLFNQPAPRRRMPGWRRRCSWTSQNPTDRTLGA